MTSGIYKHNKHSEETKKKISESHKGKCQSIESIRKLSDSKKGRSFKHKGQFKVGYIPWNKSKSKKQPKREQRRYNGKVLLISHINYMTFHKLSEIPEGFIIHHIDENYHNNKVSNLRLMRLEDHLFLHNMINKERYNFNNKVKQLKDRMGNTTRGLESEYDRMLFYRLLEEIFGKEISNG